MTIQICKQTDLIENSGVCALINEEQVAIFFLPDTEQKVFAVSNWDPIGQANVISRGIIGGEEDELFVASPLYKQRFSLTSGKCYESPESLKVYPVALGEDGMVYLS